MRVPRFVERIAHGLRSGSIDVRDQRAIVST
jgi:hypothetical protein